MKALVYGGPGEKTWTDVPVPRIQNPSDVIVKVEATTVCGTGLHILAEKKVPAEKFATHHFSLDQIIKVYDTFARAAETKAPKVVITA